MKEPEVEAPIQWKKVCDITTGLARAYKSRRLYAAANSPIPRSSLETVLSTLTSFLEENDTLTLTISESEFLYSGKAVYANPDRRESLAFRLYRDGMRILIFHAGLTLEEMEAFLEALGPVSTQNEEGDTDVVTQMWERELVHITYVAVDDCLDSEDSEEEGSQQGPASHEPSSAPMEALEDGIGVATMVDLPLTEEERRSIANVSLSQEELEEIGYQILAEEKEDPREKVFRIFLEVLQSEANVEVKADVAQGLGVLCRGFLNLGNPAHAATLLREVKGLLAKKASLPEELERIFTALLEGQGQEKELIRLEPKIEDASLQELTGYEQYLCELLPNSVRPLCGILGRMRSRRGREMLSRVLSILARDNLEALADLLSDPRWHLVRNIVYILRLMKDRRALVYLEGLLSHEEARVRREVVYCLAEINGQQSKILLTRCLRDTEQEVRKLAVRKLSQMGGDSTASLIAECVLEKTFIKRSFDEKREFFDALGRSGTDDIVPVLEGLLKKRTLFHIAELEEMKRCAATALARIGTRRAIEVLETAARKTRGKVRRACAEALKLYSSSPPTLAEEVKQGMAAGTPDDEILPRER